MNQMSIALILITTISTTAAALPQARHPIVIAHRGASGYLPEHTLEAYAMAHAMGADFIEPDLVMTRDGVLVCLHDIHLEAVTDAAKVFPNRKRKDGRWYAVDFDLEEIKRLEVKERLSHRFRQDSRGFQVPAFEELIEMVQELNRLTGRQVGLYPETKEPAFHDAAGVSMEAALLTLLDRYGYRDRNDRVFVQSFDPGSLKKMRFGLKTRLPLVQLIGGGSGPGGLFDRMVTPKGLDEIARYADGIGPSKRRIEDKDGRSVQQNALVKAAHVRGLLVHPYTFRAESDTLLSKYRSMEEEVTTFFKTYQVDGLFTDFPDRAVSVRDQAIP